jgi:hypothetical protein
MKMSLMKNRNGISTTILLVTACVGVLPPNAFGVVPPPDGLLFYDRDPRTVQGEFYTTDGKGGISLLRQQVGWRTSWTHIIPGKFGGSSSFADLLFYDAAAGLGQFYATDGRGGIHLLREQPSLRTGWTHIIPGKFGGTGVSTDLLFYDAAAGLGQFYAINGPGRISLLKQHTDWPTSWKQIVPGRFRELPPSPAPVTDLLVYDSAAGTVEFYAINGPGSISLLKRHTGWGSGWTQIIPGNFGGSSSFTDLLFYDAAAGKGEFYTTNGHGELFPLNKYTGWRSSWTQIIPGQFRVPPVSPAPPASVTDLLFYDAAAGTGEFYTTDGPGRISLLKQHTDWRRTWARITPGLFARTQTSPKYPLLPIPEKYRSPSGEPGQILLEGRAFKVGAYHGETDDEADWHVHLDLPSETQTDLIAATGVPLGVTEQGFWCEIMVNDDWSKPTFGDDKFFSADVSRAFRLTKPGSKRTAWDLMLQAIDHQRHEQDFSAFSTLIDGNVWLQGPFVKDAAHGFSEIHPLDSIAFAIDKAGKTVTARPGEPDWPRGSIRWRVAWFANSHFHRINNEPFLHKVRTTTWMLPLPLGNPIGGVDVAETKVELLDVPTGTRYVSRGVAQEPTWDLVSTRPGRPPSMLRVSAIMKEPDKFGGLAVRDYQITLQDVVGRNTSTPNQ